MKVFFQKQILFPRLAAVLLFCLAAVCSLFGQETDDLTRALREEIKKRREADLAVVASLLDAGADPNGISDEWWDKTFLMEALDNHSNKIAEMLLDYGADPLLTTNEKHGKRSAAFYANKEGRDLLASRGVRFDITDKDGRSPLMSSWDQETEMYTLEWEEQHSPNFSARFETRKEYLTSRLAALLSGSFLEMNKSENSALAERYIDAGADPAAPHKEGFPVAYLAVRPYKNSSLYLVPLLIRRGAPVDAFNGKGQTALWCAAAGEDDYLIDFLLDMGADPNQKCQSGETPLMAVQTMHALNALIKAGADPNIQDKDGETALMKTNGKFRRERAFVDQLLKAGADPTLRDNKGRTVLHHRLSLLESEALLGELLARGCLVDQPDNVGYTPLMFAAQYGFYPKTVESFLRQGADPNLRGPKGRTALHLYLLDAEDDNKYSFRDRDYKPLTKDLLAAGTRPAETDDEGDSALATAIRMAGRHKELIPLRDLVQQYASDEEVKLASASANKTVRKERGAVISENMFASAMILGVPLVIGGLSIGMREGVYANNPSGNWMGPVNGGLTLGAAGFFLGGGIGLAMVQASDMGIAGIIPLIFVAGGGLAGGLLLATLPGVQSAFKQTPVLYYIPTAATAIIASVLIFTIWVD